MMQLPTFAPAADARPAATLETPRGALPLRAVSVRARIAGATADVEVEQTFENPYDETLEVSYVFPLPDLAAVTRCELRVADRVVIAKLEERGVAREAYDAAIEQGQRAALAEQDRPGVFTITLGNLVPGERATVRFAMAYPLPREDGRHVFRFPLVVGERYVPGVPLPGDRVGDGTHADTTEAPDASRISPPRHAAGAERPALAIEIVLEHGELGVEEVESSLHAVEEVRDPDRRVVRLVAGQLMDRDFVLRFRLGGESIRSQLSAVPDPTGDEGTFQLTIVPPVAAIRPRPRDLVLVLDRSGSMDGWKIVAARRALARMIDGLDDADRFAAYAFGSETIASADLAFDRLHAATATHRARVAEFLRGVSASGGTEMAHPLALATALLEAPDPARDRWLVLVTDGQVANEDALVALVAKTPHVKVLALGIDDAINSSLLRRLASATGGRVELVQQASELEDSLDRLHVLIAAPALERVVVAGDAVVDGTLVPAGPLHAFPGVPLVVRGRYRGVLGSLRVTALARREPFELVVASARCELPALRTCWAREQLLALEDRYAAHAGERRELVGKIVATSIQFGVLCRFTAFIAIDDRGSAGPITTRRVQQPVEHTLPAIAKQSRVGVTRWGSSGATSARQTRTQSGTLRGKLSYLSPEQARGLPLEPPHEVHALAHLLWELLCGKRLFDGQSDFENLTRIAESKLPSPLLPRSLAALEPTLLRALAKDPAHRHATPRAFADALEAIVAPASAAEVGAWLAGLDTETLARQDALHARIAGLRIPARGYIVIELLELASESSLYFAARSGAQGPDAVVLRRLLAHVAEDPDHVEAFLSEVSLALAGIGHTDDAGTDSAGGVFRAQPFVRGLSLQEVLRALHKRGTGAPAAIAVAVICEAARALERALSLPTPSGAIVGMLGRDLAPSSLRIGLDGHAVWTSLGIAPSPHYTAPRRLAVALATTAGVDLDHQTTPVLPNAIVSRSVVVPKTASIPPAEPARRRRWWT